MTNARTRLAGTNELLVQRRMVGLLVVVAVLSTVVVVGAIRGRVVHGDAAAQPLRSAPGVGDCLTENPHVAGVDVFGWLPELPSLDLRPCAGSRFGEVVFVEADFPRAMAAIEPESNPYLRCTTEADRYLAIPPRLLGDSVISIPPRNTSRPEFSPTVNVSVAFLGPDDRQRAAGQRWGACIVLLPTSVIGEGPVTVDHSLRDSWLRIDDSHLFSLCLSGPTSHVALNCSWPHRIEMIGMGWGNPDATQVSLDSACRESAVEAIGSASALDEGTVTAAVVPVRPNTSNDGGLISGPDAVSAGDPYLNICLVRATDDNHQLAAPLRGLGNAPVPIR